MTPYDKPDSTTGLNRWFVISEARVCPENRLGMCSLSYYPAPLAKSKHKSLSLNSPRARSSTSAAYRADSIATSDETFCGVEAIEQDRNIETE